MPARVALTFLTVVAACQPTPAPATHRTATSDVAAPAPPLPTAGDGVRFVEAPTQGDVAQLVRDMRARTHGALLVYVGATWCEPCQYFHRAVEAHDLDATFPGLRLLEFDLDRDATRLSAAGYSPRMIPLFAVPDSEGRASGHQMEGSIHGPESVQEIVPRLRALLGP
jgi:hypothetical protein